MLKVALHVREPLSKALEIFRKADKRRAPLSQKPRVVFRKECRSFARASSMATLVLLIAVLAPNIEC